MATIVNCQVPPDVLRQLEEQLSPKDFRAALYNVIVKTQGKLLTAIKREVKAENPLIKKKYLDRALVVIKPRGDPPVGAVIVNNKRIPLIAFKVSGFANPGPGGSGGKITIANDLAPIVLRHGFLATVKATSRSGDVSEHTGIFLRARFAAGQPRKSQKGQPVQVTPLGFAERLPIRQQFGPGILKIVEIPEVLKRVEFDVVAEMRLQALSQLNRFLNPKAPAPSATP